MHSLLCILHSKISRNGFLAAFAVYKSLVSVRFCYNIKTNARTAYLTFVDVKDAIDARLAKDDTYVGSDEKRIKVMRCSLDPQVLEGGLLVKNFTYKAAQLKNLFTEYGHVLGCRVILSDDGNSNEYAYIQFTTKESAYSAVANLNNFEIEGKKMSVTKIVEYEGLISHSLGLESYANLLVRNLDPETTPAVLKEQFSLFGNIVSMAVAKSENGMSKGFGYLHFERSEDGKKALEKMNDPQFGCVVAKLGVLHYKGTKIFVKNIDDEVSKDDLRSHFSACGTITSDMQFGQGFCLLSFSTVEEANNAVSTFHGSTFHGKPLHVKNVNEHLGDDDLKHYFSVSAVWVICNEGYLTKVHPEVFSCLKKKDIFKLTEETSEFCPIHLNITQNILMCLIEFAKRYREKLTKKELFDFEKSYLAALSVEQLYDTLFAASFLRLKELIDLVSKKLVNVIRGKSANDLGELFKFCKDIKMVDYLTQVNVEARYRIENLIAYPVVHELDDEHDLDPAFVEELDGFINRLGLSNTQTGR